MYTAVNPSCKGGKLHGRGSASDEKWPTYTTVRIIRCSSSLSFNFGRIFVMRRLICTIALAARLSSFILPFFSIIPSMI